MKPYYEDESAVIYNANCLEVIPLLSFDIVVTDPPYGVGGSPHRGGSVRGTLDNLGRGPVFEWDCFDYRWLSLWPGPAAVFIGTKNVFRLAEAMLPDGALAYVKSNPHPNGSSFELCLTRGFGVGGRHVLAYNAFNGQSHDTQKPLRVMTFVVSRAPGGIICDPFMGSGTTLVAAKRLGRKAIGIETNESYCAIAVRRLAQLEIDL